MHLRKTLTKSAALLLLLIGCGCENNIGDAAVFQTILVDKKPRHFAIFPKSVKPSTHPTLLIFFHGLIRTESASAQFAQLIHAIKDFDSLIVVFPLGLKGAFPDHPEMLGWTPNHFNASALFLKKILSQCKKTYQLNDGAKVLAGGFSNGAYFLSQILQSPDADLFSGFWLQGGGGPRPLPPYLTKKKVVLEVGALDSGNIDSVKQLKFHLLQEGWEESHTLFYLERDHGHAFHTDHVINILKLLEE